MYKNSIIESYVASLYESDKIPAPKKAEGPAVGDLQGPTDEVTPDDNLEDVDLKKLEKPEQFQGISEEGVKTNNMNKLTAFDRLFKRAINEDFGDDEMTPGGMGGGLEGGGEGLEGGIPGDDDMGLGDDDQGGDVTFTLDRETAKKLHEVLGSVLSEDDDADMGMGDHDDDEYSEYEDEDEGGDDEPVTEEEIDAEVHGHALVDTEKLNKGMNKSTNKVVKGAVPNPGGKADAGVGGKKSDGKLSAHNDKGQHLQGKDNKVHSRNSNVGKFALED